MPPNPEASAEPWARQYRETGKAYEAFLVYRDLGLSRGAMEVSRRLAKRAELIRRWRKAWAWDERCAAWDAHLAEARDTAWQKAQTAHPDEIALMNARHAQMAQGLQQKALLRLAELRPADLSPPQVLAYLVEAVKIERLARGEAKQDVPEGEEADQDIVVRLLADPTSRGLAERLAAAAGHAGQNGHGAD
jgi:hypothetical protein